MKAAFNFSIVPTFHPEVIDDINNRESFKTRIERYLNII